jgi:hypothetical protein
MSTGLFMLQPQVSVTVTREEYHQQVLGRYPITDAGYQITAELAWCTIGAGKYRGQRGIEVRLGGERVGELTYAMSQRYAAMLEQVTGRGYRPGCEAYVFLGKRGVEIELRLPRENTRIVFPVAPAPVPPQVRRSAAVPVPAAGTARAQKTGVNKPALIAVGVVGAFLVIGMIASQGDDSSSAGSGPVANVTTSSSTASSTVVAPPVITTTTTSVAPPPPPAPPAPPAPKTSKTTKPAPPPKDTPAPPPPPAGKCDPNYSGCVPIAADVDCKPGSGNGPAYVRGPVQVIGTDIYGLDADDDGVGCE